MIDVIVLFIVLMLGLNLSNIFKNKITFKDQSNFKKLWIYHVFFGVIYWAYIEYGPGGDAYAYYKVAKELSFTETFSFYRTHGPGTYAIYLLNVIPAKFIGFFGMTMIYTLLGYIGIIYFYMVFKNQIKFNTTIGKTELFPLIFFLPNLHFWSAGLGKDTILFFCIGMFIYSMQKPSENIIKIILALSLSYLIRPHITVFLIASFGIGYVLDGNLKAYQKIFLGGVFFILFILLFDNIMTYLKLEDLDTESIEQFSETRASNLSREHTGSAIDISGYPFPFKIFTFLYRPLFFDARSILALVASFENLLLLVLSWRFIKLNPIKIFNVGNYMVKSMFIFLIIGSVSFSIILGNLGIILRQKNMFVPALLFICLWGFSYNADQKKKKYYK